MRSDAFDPYVVLSEPEGDTVHEQDDGGEDFDTQFMVTLPEDGTYPI